MLKSPMAVDSCSNFDCLFNRQSRIEQSRLNTEMIIKNEKANIIFIKNLIISCKIIASVL